MLAPPPSSQRCVGKLSKNHCGLSGTATGSSSGCLGPQFGFPPCGEALRGQAWPCSDTIYAFELLIASMPCSSATFACAGRPPRAVAAPEKPLPPVSPARRWLSPTLAHLAPAVAPMAAPPAAAVNLCAGQAVATSVPTLQLPAQRQREGLPQPAAAAGSVDSSDASSEGSLRAVSSGGLASTTGRAAASSGASRPAHSCAGGGASEDALPATPRLKWDSCRLRSAASAAVTPPELRMPGTPRLQAAAAGAEGEEPSTPCPGRYRFGDPFSPPPMATPNTLMLGSLDSGCMRSMPQGSLRGR